MKRNYSLLAGTAAVFVLVGCQPTTQDGGTGATPDDMPADTATTDTMMGDTLTRAQPAQTTASLPGTV